MSAAECRLGRLVQAPAGTVAELQAGTTFLRAAGAPACQYSAAQEAPAEAHRHTLECVTSIVSRRDRVVCGWLLFLGAEHATNGSDAPHGTAGPHGRWAAMAGFRKEALSFALQPYQAVVCVHFSTSSVRSRGCDV
jgi:hypothetical protein